MSYQVRYRCTQSDAVLTTTRAYKSQAVEYAQLLSKLLPTVIGPVEVYRYGGKKPVAQFGREAA